MCYPGTARDWVKSPTPRRLSAFVSDVKYNKQSYMGEIVNLRNNVSQYHAVRGCKALVARLLWCTHLMFRQKDRSLDRARWNRVHPPIAKNAGSVEGLLIQNTFY